MVVHEHACKGVSTCTAPCLQPHAYMRLRIEGVLEQAINNEYALKSHVSIVVSHATAWD